MNFKQEIETLIRARYPILYILSSEEARVQSLAVEIAQKRQKKIFEWTCSNGIVPAGTSIQSQKQRNSATKEPLAALDQVIDQVEPAIFLFKDFHPFLTKNNYAVIRKLTTVALRSSDTGVLYEHKTGLTLCPAEAATPRARGLRAPTSHARAAAEARGSIRTSSSRRSRDCARG